MSFLFLCGISLMIVSTSGCIHEELLRLLCLLADEQTACFFQALGDEVDVDSEVYCWRRSGFFWRMLSHAGCPWFTVRASRYPVH